MVQSVRVAQGVQGPHRLLGFEYEPILGSEFLHYFRRPEIFTGLTQPLLPGVVEGLQHGVIDKEVAPLQVPDDGHAGQVLHESGKQPFTLLQLLFRLFQVADVGDGGAAQPWRR